MSQIKSFADQLRNQLKNSENEPLTEKKQTVSETSLDKKNKPRSNNRTTSDKTVETFFQELREFKIEVTQKSMIRMDEKTMNLLKHIKLCKDIDMNRFIVFCLHKYLAQHPWLPHHIQETLKKISL